MAVSFKGFQKVFASIGQSESRILGIDIGSSSLKVVQLRKEKERAILETYGEIAIGPYAKLKVGQAANVTEDIVVEILKDVLKEANCNAKTASVAIPLKSSFVTIISLPFVPDKNISEIIQIEARRYIPIPLPEVLLDWWILPERVEKNVSGDPKNLTRVLLVAIHKDVINSYKNIISRAGLKAKAYEIESFSMIRSIVGRESMPVVVLDFGASTTKLAVVDYGVMKASHLINQGAQNLTLSLSHALNVDFNRGEELKREIGLSDLPEHKEAVAVFEPILDYIFSEANLFIKDFQRKYRRSIGKMVLCGGGAMLKGMVDFAVKRFTIEVELAEPFSKLEHPVFLSNVLKEVGVNFSVAVGLALREL